MNQNLMHFLFCICLVASYTAMNAQGRCGSEYVEHHAAALNPNYESDKVRIEKAISDAIRDPSLSLRSEVYIPVVVHVVYYNNVQKISEAQVRSQIELLNADFSALLIPDGIPEEFADRYEDIGIRFCLAKNDPDGNPTNGITYHSTSIDNIGLKVSDTGEKKVQHAHLGGADAWPTDKYLNIWVCQLDEFLGYATAPGAAFFPGEDGVVINYTNFGNIGTVNPKGPYNLGRTTTHEVGHYFSLLHLWGKNANGCGDDLVEDTPNQSLPHYGCPKYPQLSCFTSNMFMNYMDYVDDECMYMFTPGQGLRMRSALESARSSLLNSGNTHCDQNSLFPTAKLCDRITLKSTLAHDQITLIQDAGYNEVLYLTLFDISGRELNNYIKISQQEINIPLEQGLVPGMYVLNVRTKEDRFAFKFLIINK